MLNALCATTCVFAKQTQLRIIVFASGVDCLVTGPPENAMWALGDKIASSIVAQTAGVPTLPWSGSGNEEALVQKLIEEEEEQSLKLTISQP